MKAGSIASALGGRKIGSGWTARCPAHDDQAPSLSLRDTDNGLLLIHCHAGCTQREVITALRLRGLWIGNGASRSPISPLLNAQSKELCHEEARRVATALSIWRVAVPANGTLITKYLTSRGLEVSPPPTLRFHPGLKHPSGGVWPCMVALVARGPDGAPLAIHRTFLACDGSGKAPVKPQRMMLGPCRGGAVRLAEPGDVLMVGEGIETCLAAMQASGHSAWAALSTSGLRYLDLPAGIRDVIVLADGDEAGEAAAGACAYRWKREGRRVRVARPPRGLDFNDLLLGRASRITKGAQ
jgi:putative DNA primase/helicase